MITPTKARNYLPSIRSLITSDYVKPTEWIDEIEKKGNIDTIATIEIYEFIIACLIKAISFISIDKSLMDKVDNIYKDKNEYMRKYFNLNKGYIPLFIILRFIDFKKCFGKQNEKKETDDFCNAWNNYYHFVFDSNENLLNIDLKKIMKNGLKHDVIPFIECDSIVNLFEFFDNNKHVIKTIAPINDIAQNIFFDYFSKYCGSQDIKINRSEDDKIFKHILNKSYSDVQAKLIYRNRSYFHLMETLQSEELQNILNLKSPIISNSKGFFILSKPRNFFCEIVQRYCKKYNETNNPSEKNLGIEWSYFDKCMKDGKKTAFNLIENKNTIRKDNKIESLMDEIVGFISNFAENSDLFRSLSPKQISFPPKREKLIRIPPK